MNSLPVVADCEGCGACCMHMGYPAYVLENAQHPAEEHWLSLPNDLKQELESFISGYRAPAKGQLDGPCFWFDQKTRRCKHHDHRPRVCRDFAVGNPECLDWRDWLSEKSSELPR